MAENKKPDYDILMPAHVLHDNSISPSARLIYGEIAALCVKSNCCCFDVSLFSDLYGVSKKTMSNVNAKHISVEPAPSGAKPDSKKMNIALIGYSAPGKNNKPGNNSSN